MEAVLDAINKRPYPTTPPGIEAATRRLVDSWDATSPASVASQADWQLKVGDRVRYCGPYLPQQGNLGVIDERKLGVVNGTERCGVTWDKGSRSGERRGELELVADQPTGLKAPEGVTLRYVSAEEYERLHRGNFKVAKDRWSVMGGAGVEAADLYMGHTNASSLSAAQTSLDHCAKPGEVWLVCSPVNHPFYPKESHND